MNASNRRPIQVAVLSAIAIAVVAVAGLTLSLAAKAPAQTPAAIATAPAPVVGVATGELDNGLPVYRLPTVAVSASRSEELAKMMSEEPLALSK